MGRGTPAAPGRRPRLDLSSPPPQQDAAAEQAAVGAHAARRVAAARMLGAPRFARAVQRKPRLYPVVVSETRRRA